MESRSSAILQRKTHNARHSLVLCMKFRKNIWGHSEWRTMYGSETSIAYTHPISKFLHSVVSTFTTVISFHSVHRKTRGEESSQYSPQPYWNMINEAIKCIAPFQGNISEWQQAYPRLFDENGVGIHFMYTRRFVIRIARVDQLATEMKLLLEIVKLLLMALLHSSSHTFSLLWYIYFIWMNLNNVLCLTDAHRPAATIGYPRRPPI